MADLSGKVDCAAVMHTACIYLPPFPRKLRFPYCAYQGPGEEQSQRKCLGVLVSHRKVRGVIIIKALAKTRVIRVHILVSCVCLLV